MLQPSAAYLIGTEAPDNEKSPQGGTRTRYDDESGTQRGVEASCTTMSKIAQPHARESIRKRSPRIRTGSRPQHSTGRCSLSWGCKHSGHAVPGVVGYPSA